MNQYSICQNICFCCKEEMRLQDYFYIQSGYAVSFIYIEKYFIFSYFEISYAKQKNLLDDKENKY
jgi:hypothetical protein